MWNICDVTRKHANVCISFSPESDCSMIHFTCCHCSAKHSHEFNFDGVCVCCCCFYHLITDRREKLYFFSCLAYFFLVHSTFYFAACWFLFFFSSHIWIFVWWLFLDRQTQHVDEYTYTQIADKNGKPLFFFLTFK